MGSTRQLAACLVLSAVAVAIGSWREPARSECAQPADLDRDGVRRAVTEQFVPAARRCYHELLRREPDAQGRVTLELDVVRDGDRGVVDRCEVVDAQSEIDDTRFRGCLVDAMKTVIFDAPTNDRVKVVYPFIFKRAR